MVRARRDAGQTVLHMGFGESPFPVPPRLLEALQKESHQKNYLPTAGLQELREAVASYYKRKTGLDTSRFDVIVAPGSKLILYALQMAVEGDLLMPVPSWVSYGPQSRMLQRDIIKVPTTLDEAGFHIDPDALRSATHAARAEGKNPAKLILNSPSNPTGLTIPENELEAIARVCQEEDIFIISDEIYGFITFDGHYRSIAKYAPERTAVSSGLSKHLSLGGWRIGIGFIPKAVDGLHNLMSNIASETWSCVPSPIQRAVIEAYREHEDIESHIRACTDIHALMSGFIATSLRNLGVIAPPPQGAFYNYPDFAPHRESLATAGIRTSTDLAGILLADYGLATLPGTAFGADPDSLTLRLSSCDYDGAAALAARQNGAPLDEAFIDSYAPHVRQAVETFGKFIRNIKKAAPTRIP